MPETLRAIPSSRPERRFPFSVGNADGHPVVGLADGAEDLRLLCLLGLAEGSPEVSRDGPAWAAFRLAWDAMPANSRRALGGDAAFIAAWAAAQGLPWPFDEAAAVAFITQHVEGFPPAIAAGLERRGFAASAKPNTLKRRLSSLATLHAMSGHGNPLYFPACRVALKALRQWRRQIAARKAPALTGAMIARMLELILQQAAGSQGADRLRALRDAALIAFAFSSGGRRRSESVGVNFEDCSFIEAPVGKADGKREMVQKVLVCRLARGKTTEAGREVVVSGSALTILASWLDEAGIDSGPLFRSIGRSGRISSKGLSDRSVWTIVHERAAAAGYAASAHSIRAGFMTEAGLSGLTLQEGMEMSLHASVQQASSYHRPGRLAAGPASRLLDRFIPPVGIADNGMAVGIADKGVTVGQAESIPAATGDPR